MKSIPRKIVKFFLECFYGCLLGLAFVFMVAPIVIFEWFIRKIDELHSWAYGADNDDKRTQDTSGDQNKG